MCMENNSININTHAMRLLAKHSHGGEQSCSPLSFALFSLEASLESHGVRELHHAASGHCFVSRMWQSGGSVTISESAHASHATASREPGNHHDNIPMPTCKVGSGPQAKEFQESKPDISCWQLLHILMASSAAAADWQQDSPVTVSSGSSGIKQVY